MKSWKAEVVADNSGKFCGNGVRLATKKEAEDYAVDLQWRWILVREWRVVESDDPVNYVWTENGARSVKEMEKAK
jgi:hypothetical protein